MTAYRELEFAQAFEIGIVPIIPVSGLSNVCKLSDGNLVFTFFQEVPSVCGQIERHVCLRTMWSPFTYRETLPRILPIIGGRVSWLGVGAH